MRFLSRFCEPFRLGKCDPLELRRQANRVGGKAQVKFQSIFERGAPVVTCRRLVVTVPLGVLQAKPSARGAIQFDPEPRRIFTAARSLRFGHAYRVTFRFPYAFWEDEEKLQRAGFLVSREKQFLTWWTTHPVLSPLLTAWTAGRRPRVSRFKIPLRSRPWHWLH
jgi:Flavin containing amine oxidoreductase